MYRILKGDLNSPSKFKGKLHDYIVTLRTEILKRHNIEFDIEEIGDLLLSVCRSNDFNVISQEGNRMFLDDSQVQEWINKKLIPNTVIVNLDDEDVVRLLVFCLEITYQMFGGGTRATVTQKGFRQRRRTFESILVDQFVGKLGEIFVKKFLEESYPVSIELDWKISTQIEKYRNDIMNAKRNLSIKSSPTLAGVWAEADIGYDYGIMVKCSVPQQPILQFFIEVCGFTRLLDFAEERIPQQNGLFKDYLGEIRERIRKYKCGEIQTSLKGFICGYFKTSKSSPVKEGVSLPYLGIVREERYLVPINKLKWTKDDWKEFLEEVELL
ncbi:MAG: hypothetical protein H0Z30_09595 [Candidatus Marinimicrobia bacterium]|nr:hypothetical protein [Candidatus Neomarinimicrobiota bacterium]